MKTLLLLAAVCCGCYSLPLQTLQRRKRETTVIEGTNLAEGSGIIEDDGAIANKSIFSHIWEANKGSFIFQNFVIRHLDIAYRTTRSSSGCSMGVCLWPKSSNNVYIPYTISTDFSLYATQLIAAAMLDIESVTCIRFTKRTSEQDYLSFENQNGCWSAVGRIGGGQTISLSSSDCIWGGIVTHEILHALGLHHEHVRKDRDGYVTVYWDNIEEGNENNFMMTDTLNMGLTNYDYGSIMHYSKNTFSKNGLPTLEGYPNKDVTLGQNFAMSYLDTVKINSLYNCAMSVASNGLQNSADQVRTLNLPTTTPTTTTTATTTTRATTTRTSTQSSTTTKPTTTSTTTRSTTTKTTTFPTTTRTTTATATTTTTTTAKNACNFLLTAPKGVITSPNYPGIYPNNAFCHWNISTTSKIKITFTDFDVEGVMGGCAFDKLMICNGRVFNLPRQCYNLCGKGLPEPITSNENIMQIVFISDSSVGGKGFSIEYEAE